MQNHYFICEGETEYCCYHCSGSIPKPIAPSPIGDTILDCIEEHFDLEPDWPKIPWLAWLMGWTETYATALCSGNIPLTEEHAAALSSKLGSTKEFWLARDINYRTELEKLKLLPDFETFPHTSNCIAEKGKQNEK